MFDLTTNYFQLFGLPVGCEVDPKQLKQKYLELQRQYHPDNFAAESEATQRQAVQQVSYLNQAYDTLKSPLKRAVYLLHTAGHDYDPDTQIHDDTEFLMQQMELREELSEISIDSEELDQLRAKASTSFEKHKNQFADSYGNKKWQEAGAEINKMMFLSKLLTEIDEKEEVLLG